MAKRNLPLQFDLFTDWLVTASPAPSGAAKQETSPELQKIVQQPKPSGLSDGSRYLLAQRLAEKLGIDGEITAEFLTATANSVFGGSQSEGVYSPKDAYDAMEAAFNLHLARSERETFLFATKDAKQARDKATQLTRRIQLLPTQTRRDGEMDELQQFSTPPPLAFVANWVANVTAADHVLEPSAGTGDLAIWAQLAGARLTLNELSDRRHALLSRIFPDASLFKENAEQLNNVLPRDIIPSVIVMNPPFSSSAARVPRQRDTLNGARHIEQALLRLAEGGRLVAIVGSGMAADRPAFKTWWSEIEKQYTVRANVGISGREYAKYGTSFDNQLIVIDKTGLTTEPVITAQVGAVADLPEVLANVRNQRHQSQRGIAESTGGSPTEPIGNSLQPAERTGRPGADPGSTRAELVGSRSAAGAKSVAGQTGGQSSLGDDTHDRVRTRGEIHDDAGGLPAGSSGPDSGGNHRESRSDSAGVLTVEPADNTPEEFTDSVFARYSSKRIAIPGAQPHPGNLVQSAAMAAVDPPIVRYSPVLPRAVIDAGLLSVAQLEAIIYAGAAHSELLPNGSRRGFFLGDGTGVGKGREISGIILDNMLQGRTKALWISFNEGLLNDAQRDFCSIGGDPAKIFFQGKTKPGNEISQDSGILFTTYSTLRSGEKRQASDTGQDAGKTRLEQIVDWLGRDFDGVIAFDEAHSMGNAVAIKGKRGLRKPSQQALAGINLQRELPNARVVYVSATGATEISNLSYADRLGLWGEGTPFADLHAFIGQISEGGIAAMELISRDMKAMGMYIARSLSFDGVTYERLEHPLSELQEDIYNELAGAWQIVLNNVNEALKITQAGKNGAAKSAAMAQFWGAHQRFFNQILTSMQTPAVIDHMRQHIDAGHAVVIQLVNTNEATQERIVAAATANDIPLEDLDFTPRQMLIDYVRNGFPVAAFEESADDNGNRIYVPVRDREGNQVFDRQAIAMRDGLLATLHEIRVPENPIDLIINAFGADRVAEVTGRTRRYTQSRDDEGNLRVVEEKRGRNASRLDADAFQNDAKKILIFSAAGGTGYSFHADNTAANTRKRVHYLLQPGWRADAAVQGFGRTHRSNQSCAPQYVLPTTNLKAQKRFVSSIARRLDQLGALTRGQRQATTQGMFTASDNLESEYAKIGLRNFFVDLYRGETALSFQDVTQQMGLILIDQNGAFSESSIPNIPQFLNRLLSLRTGLQNQVFDEFEHRLVEAVEYAKQRGTYDEGLQTLKALSIRKTRDDIAYEDPKTGAQTRYVELAVTNTLHYHPWEDITAIAQRADGPLSCWFVSERGVNKGQVFFLAGRGERLDAEGNTVQRGVIYGIRKNSHRYIDNADVIHRGWDYREIGGSLQQVTISRQVTQAQAERLWKAQLRAAPKTETTSACMLVGVILPIWDRVAGAETIYRLQTDDGEQLLGRFLEPTAAKQTLHNLGLHSKTAELSADETFGAIKSGKRAVLSNGWEVSLSIVNHEPRIEIKANTLTDAEKRLLTAQGAFVERISWTERVFIPAGSNGPAIFARITASKPVVDIFQRRREGSAGPSVTNTPESDAQEARLPELNGDDDRQRSRSNLTANLGASMAKKKHHELVAEKLIEQLKQGTAPWQRPWDPCDRLLPVNPITGKRYRGANLIALMCEERTDCRWMTFRQAAAKGWQVRSGERGTTIQFWKFSDEQTNTDENGKPVKVTVQLERPRVFYATVFNAEQIDGIPPLDLLKPPQWNAHERAEQILNAAGAVIKYVPGAGPFYRASTDTIQLPYRGQFPTADGFYAIALHETAHASGHPTRLNRELLGHPFGSEGYAKEELRAEIASMIIGDELGIGHDPRQHAAYVGSWIKILKDDPLEIFRAAAEAERIQEYVLGLEQRREQEQALEETLDELHRDAQQLEVPMQTAKQINDYEQAVTAARLREAQVKANPDSTREEISAAREDRKLAELIATLNDEELQRLKANYERDVQTERDNASAEATRTARERQYLAVPYAERNAAKAAGALWDRAAKSWYAGPKAAMQKIQRWLPGNIAPRQKPALSPRDEFAEALRSVGCLVSGDHPIMDGQKHRITVQGEKYSENSGSGFYVGHLDGHPAGYIKNNRTGVELRWKSKGYALSDAQQAQLRADSANKLRARADEQNRLHEAAAQRVAQQIATLIPIAEPTPYLNAKGIAAQPGVFTDARKQTTFVPATDADGKLWTVQYIQPDGTKRFAKGSRKEGCLHVVGGFDALAKAPVLVISEGYATAATLSQALGFATVAAFDSGNLVPVAKALHEKFPEKKIVVAGDDDKHLELTQGVNPGRCKAEEAAKAAGGTVLFPVFAPGETSYPTGLDPVTPEKFRKGVLSEEQQAALTKMKQHTDFNDLATRSALGPEAVKRQIRPAVELLKQQSSVVATQVKRARTQRNGALRAPGL